MFPSSSYQSISAFSPYQNWNNNDTPTSSSFPFSPFEESQAFLDYYHHHQFLLSYNNNHFADQENATNISASHTVNKQKTPRKERNRSKILTAKGPRDRRVRFSIETSRKFFGLQELLGFQKPSQTLDWLLTEAKPSINELLKTVDIEKYENVKFLCSSSVHIDEPKKKKADKMKAPAKRKSKGKKKLVPDMISAAKESRAKARQRARERTREKNLLRNYFLFGNNCSQFESDLEEAWFQEHLSMQRDLIFGQLPTIYSLH